MPSKKTVNKKCNQFTTSKLKEDLLRWTCERHATNGPLDRELLRHKALELSRKFGLNGFKCSSAWLTIFLKQHGFSTTLTNCCGPYFTDYRKWVEMMKPLISQYRYKDLFNVDELAMYPDILPTKISSIYDGTDEKSIKTNRLTVLTCCNSSGTEKLPPLICGPYNLTILRDDYQYHYNENSSIGKELFDDWLSQLNVLMSRKQRKILLLLRRNRIHVLKRVEHSHVNLLFLPVNFPSNLRPLKRDVFHCIKMIYRQTYVNQNIFANRKWNAKQIVDNIATAWSRVPVDLIVHSFQRTNFRPDNEFLKIDCIGWDSLNTGITFRKFVTFDDSLSDVSGPTKQPGCPARSDRHDYNLRQSRAAVIWVNECGDALTDDPLERNDSCTCFTDDDDDLIELDSRRQHSDDPRDPGVELRDVWQDSRAKIDDNFSTSEKCVDEIEKVLNDVIGTVLKNVEGSLRSIDLDDERSRNPTKSVYITCERKRSSSKRSDDRSRDLDAKNSALSNGAPEENVGEMKDFKMKTRVARSKERSIDSNRTSEVLEDFESTRSASDDDCLEEEEEEEEEDLRGRIEDDKVRDNFEIGRKNCKRDGEQDSHVKFEEREVSSKESDERRDNVEEYSRNGVDCYDPIVDDCSTSFKRKSSNLNSDVRKSDNVGEPAEKRFKRDDNWAKYYEKHFVFGTRLVNTMVDRTNEKLDEECVVECCKLVSQSKQCKPRTGEFEKSILAIGNDLTPGLSKE